MEEDIAASPPSRGRRTSQLTPLHVPPRLAIVIQPATPITPRSSPPVTPINTTLLSPPSLKRRPSSKSQPSGPSAPPPRPASAPPRLSSFNRPGPSAASDSSLPWYLSRNSLTARRTGRTVTVPPPPLGQSLAVIPLLTRPDPPQFDPPLFGGEQTNPGCPIPPIRHRFTSSADLRSLPPVSISINPSLIFPHSLSNQGSSAFSQHPSLMFLGNLILPILICAGRAVAVGPVVARQETTIFLFGPPTTFDWWPFDDFQTSLVPQPSFTSEGPSQSPATTTLFSSSSSSSLSPSPSPSIIDITALPPAAANSPHPRARARRNLKPPYLAPVFVLAGLLPGAFMGWLAFRSYQRWLAKSTTVSLLPGPAYLPVERVGEGTGDGRGRAMDDVEGSPSKRTRHGAKYSSYSIGRGLLGRIPSSRFYKPLPMISQERSETASSEKSFAWPPLPGSSRPTPSHSRATTPSTKSTQMTTVIPDDPFISTENTSTGADAKPQNAAVASRTSTRSTFAPSSRFGEVWSGDEEDQDAVVVPSFGPTDPTEGEGERRSGFLEKIRSKSRSVKGRKRGDKSELASPVKQTSPRKSSWNFPWISGSPTANPDSYTVVPARTSSPRSQSFKTPESSPRKPSYVRAGEKARFVDRSVLPASPPTLTSPRLESEFFLSALVVDVPGTPTPKRTRSSRLRRGKEPYDADSLLTASHPSLYLGDSERSDESRTPSGRDSRPGPSSHPSTMSVSTISEFPGDAPRKRTPAERFHARHSALDRVEEIIQKGRSKPSVANAGASPLVLGTAGEDRRFGRAGREFESGGIEQRLAEP